MTTAVFFGGKSCEHNISVITGVQVMREISKKHEIIPIYIDNGGVFWTGKNLTNISDIQNKKLAGRKKIHLRPSSDYIYNENGKKIKKIDVALLCNHGLNGEDGSLQGLLELSGIAYSGSGVRASSAAMDKITMKQLFLQSGLPVLPFISLTYNEFKESKAELNEKIKEKLTFPLIVKPSNLGSSIGITIAHDFKELEDSLSLAFEWDNRVLVENALTDFTELNCAVLGRENDMTASEIEQPTGWKEFLTYDDKYTKKIKGGSRVFPAKITSSQKDAVQLLAKKAFTALGCAGVARCDFLLKDDNLYVNEINTIPGALSNYLFSYNNFLCFTDLIERLIDIALKEKEAKNRLKYTFKSTYSITGTKGNK